MMTDSPYKIVSNSLAKKFSRKPLFKDISFTLETGNSLCLAGPNGSGKSTLLQIIAGLKSPTRGSVDFYYNNKKIENEEINNHTGFSSPVINPYDDLTGIENIEFVLNDTNKHTDIVKFLKDFGLYDHRNKHLKYYSSGMKQRIKFICSIINNPPILFLDEPGTNLDRKGKDMIYDYIKYFKKNKIIIIATNEKEEADLCEEEIGLGK